MNAQHDMALTGIGLVSPAGRAKADFFKWLRDPAARDQAAPGQLLKRLNVTDSKLKIARYMDPVSRNAIVALGDAIRDAGLAEGQLAEAPHAHGIVFGAHRGPCETRKALYESLAAKQGKLVSATIFSHCGYNIAGAMAAIAFGLKGPNLTLAGRGDLGWSLLRTARQLLVGRRVHTLFVGFSECDGVPAEGNGASGELAYVLCLERKDRALERGAVVLAELGLSDAGAGTAAGESAPPEASDEPLPASPAGPHAAGGRYASLIRIGRLAHDPLLKARFPQIAFATSVGGMRTEVRLRWAEEGVLAL